MSKTFVFGKLTEFLIVAENEEEARHKASLVAGNDFWKKLTPDLDSDWERVCNNKVLRKSIVGVTPDTLTTLVDLVNSKNKITKREIAETLGYSTNQTTYLLTAAMKRKLISSSGRRGMGSFYYSLSRNNKKEEETTNTKPVQPSPATIREAIVHELQMRPMLPAMLRKKLNCNKSQIDNNLQALRRDGIVKSSAKGWVLLKKKK